MVDLILGGLLVAFGIFVVSSLFRIKKPTKSTRTYTHPGKGKDEEEEKESIRTNTREH